jgi:hypothetical protein
LSWLRLATPIVAPAAAKDSAMPRLMPLVPPKTKTFLPLKSKEKFMFAPVSDAESCKGLQT